MTVMSKGLLLNSKYIKMGHEGGGGGQAFLTQPPLVIVCHAVPESQVNFASRGDG